MSRREVLGGEVSINGSPAKCRQMEVLPNAGKWKSCQMQANGSSVQMQANGSSVQVQANESPVHVQAMQKWQNKSKDMQNKAKELQNKSKDMQNKAKELQNKAKENSKEKAKEYQSNISNYIQTNSNDACSEIEIESSCQTWNVRCMVFGSFHQNNERFSEQSRGFQCTSNALCMLGYSACLDINDGSKLDQILCDGDSLYQHIVDRLKADNKFIQPLLSLDEIPDVIEIEKGKFIVDKQPIVSGILVDSYVGHGLPSLHSALQSAFSTTSSGLLIIGAICSAVLRKNDSYIFFDSHSHGKNGLASSEGTSVLMSFKHLDDLVTYLYAFYHSLQIDMNLQFDFLPLTIRPNQQDTRCEFHVEHQLEAYFKDQSMRLAKKEKSKLTENNLFEVSTCKKKKKRTEYNRLYKRQQRELSDFKEKEQTCQLESKRNIRLKPGVLEKEKLSKWVKRQDTAFKIKETGYQRASKQRIRMKPGVLEKEKLSKQVVRQDTDFKIKETGYQRASKQRIRMKPGVLEKEKLSKWVKRQDTAFKIKETGYQCASKQRIRMKPGVLEKEKLSKQVVRQDTDFKIKETEYQLASKQKARKDPSFKAKETGYQRASKQSARKDPSFKTKEAGYQLASKRHIRSKLGVLEKGKISKQLVRQDSDFKIKETQYQRASKQKARRKPIVLEQERIKKQQIRQLKRQTNEVFSSDIPTKQRKVEEDYSQDCNSTKSYQDFKDINWCIEMFHSSIGVGPVFVCTCCHQTWFRKSVSMIKNINISAKDVRLYCTKLLSVNKEEWICHTCLSTIRDGKVPKLSVANGMKWPEKPKELHLHQLEERLIALRIPFMQIRELPRGGQYSLKGNVINVPVDIQPAVSCLPRPMDENFTVAIQLKKKLTYKKVDFKENVRPLKVLTALQWLLTNSELYKNSGINVANNWFQEVTESSDENVREFLEISAEHQKALNDVECQTHGQNRNENISIQTDRSETDNYESDDGYSEIDANEQVGNVDTLVDDANIESK